MTSFRNHEDLGGNTNLMKNLKLFGCMPRNTSLVWPESSITLYDKVCFTDSNLYYRTRINIGLFISQNK